VEGSQYSSASGRHKGHPAERADAEPRLERASFVRRIGRGIAAPHPDDSQPRSVHLVVAPSTPEYSLIAAFVHSGWRLLAIEGLNWRPWYPGFSRVGGRRPAKAGIPGARSEHQRIS
jgi:hypothetical protein